MAAMGPSERDASSNPARGGERAGARRLIERFRAAAVAIGLARQLTPAEALALAERALAGALERAGSLADERAFGRAVIERARGLEAPRPPDAEDGTARLRALIERRQIERKPGTGVVVRGDLEAATSALLAAVPEPARAPLALRAYAGSSYADIAAVLAISEAEAASLLAAGMEALRAAFAGAGADAGAGAGADGDGEAAAAGGSVRSLG